MKKVLMIVIAIAVIAAAVFGGYYLGRRSNKQGENIVTTEKMYSDQDNNRYIAVINDTGKVINELYILLEDGTDVDAVNNPDKDNINFRISENLKSKTTFVVRMIDNYGRLYEKTQHDVGATGVTTISVSAADYIEQSGDWWRNVSEWFNNFFGGD